MGVKKYVNTQPGTEMTDRTISLHPLEDDIHGVEEKVVLNPLELSKSNITINNEAIEVLQADRRLIGSRTHSKRFSRPDLNVGSKSIILIQHLPELYDTSSQHTTSEREVAPSLRSFLPSKKVILKVNSKIESNEELM